MKMFVFDEDALLEVGGLERRWEMVESIARLSAFGILREIEPKAIDRIKEAVPGLPLTKEDGAWTVTDWLHGSSPQGS